MVNLFPGAEITGNQIKIPKSALSRLEANRMWAQILTPTITNMDNLFAFSTQDGGVVKISKATLPGLDNSEILTAAQFFGAVLLRGQEYFPTAALWQDTHQINVNVEETIYIDFPENRLVSLFRTSIEFSSLNLGNLK